MATKIQLRRDTASNWTSENPTLSAGELGFETDTDKVKIGDGSTAWTSLGYLIDSTDDFDGTFNSLTGTPTTLSGYGITDAFDGAFSSLTGTPTTLSGYGITDAFDGAFSSLTGTPTTLSGYGITDAFDGAYSSLTGAPTNISSFTNDSGYITSYTVTQGDVTAHQAALSITESQISDLGSYLTTVALNELSDVSSSSATTGQVLTAQSDGSFAFADQTGSSSGGISFSDVTITATNGQTEFSDSTVTIQDGVTLVFLNGVRLVETTDFTVSESGNSITLVEAAELGDIVQICTFYTPASEEEGSSYTGIQGSNYGYTIGGRSAASTYVNTIDKFSLTATLNASDVGNLTTIRSLTTGHGSTTNGYSSGGSTGSPTRVSTIDKFSFSTDGDATNIGDLTTAREGASPQQSEDYGYSSGGNPIQSTIDRFAFASDGDATDYADLTYLTYHIAGQSSTENGYASGGASSSATYIQKFPFASAGNASNIGALTVGRSDGCAGTSSTTHGYTAGGWTNTYGNVIDKFPFASDADATDVGDLVFIGHRTNAGQSATEYGYTSGGYAGPPAWTRTNIIQKHSFTSDGNATDHADLTQGREQPAGTQY
jgi:hypothetical protein